MCGIYKITNLVTNKMYIGKTKGEFKNRWRNHKRQLRKGISPCKYLQNTWNKYGENNFKFEAIVEGCFNKDELKQLEEIFIKLYGHYNILLVSNENEFSKERREKASRVTKALWENPEHRKHVSEILKEKWANGERTGVAYHPAWKLYPQIKEFWQDKSNGRGGKAHPGKTKIMNKFNIPRGITQLIINKLKSDQDIQITEGYNKEEIYNFWKNRANANQAKYAHPGRDSLAKEFNISVSLASSLIKEFIDIYY